VGGLADPASKDTHARASAVHDAGPDMASMPQAKCSHGQANKQSIKHATSRTKQQQALIRKLIIRSNRDRMCDRMVKWQKLFSRVYTAPHLYESRAKLASVCTTSALLRPIFMY